MNETPTATMNTLLTPDALAAAGVRTSTAVAAVIADHAITDSKGRKVGGKALVITLTDGSFGVRSYAMRDGATFGASPTKLSGRAPDLASAIALAEKAMLAQRKRYAKLAV